MELDNDKDETFDLPKIEKTLVIVTISLDDESLIQEFHKIFRSRKTNAVKRQQRIATQYIECIEPGIFPLKSSW